jgi:phage/plasmid-like protein (TIGR03299 family)
MSDRVERYAGVVTPWWAGKSATAVSMDVVNDGRTTVPSDELFVRAGLADWDVQKQPIFITGQHAQKVPDVMATVRGKDGQYLGFVSPSYPVVQNEAMKALGDAIMGSGAEGVTAGSLMNGRIAWMTFKLDRDAVQIKGDPSPIDVYFMIRTGHDARHALGGDVTPIRTVCWNTLVAAEESALSHVYFRHTSGIEQRVGDLAREAQRALGIVPKAVEQFEARMTVLADKPMTIGEFTKFMEHLLPTNPEVDKPFKTEAQRRELAQVFETSPLLDGLGFTAYRAFNAVAEWADHVRPYNDGKRMSGDDKRAISIMDGFAATKKDTALRLLAKA